MKKKKKLGLGAIRIQSFVTSLESVEQKAVFGGSDRWFICGSSPEPTQLDCDTSQCPETENIVNTAPGAC